MKREAEQEHEESEAKKLKMEGDDGLIEIRSLIDNYDASIIIGKGGSNVKRIRTESSAFVSILRNDNSAKERIMTLKGTVEFIAHAAELIAQLLMEANNSKKEKEGQEVENSASFKILHHKACAGAIIGKGGAIIREIQETTGVRMSLSTDCLGSSSEKACTISGLPSQINVAVARVVSQLSENPPRPGTQISTYVPGAPAAGPAGYGAAPPGYGPPGYGPPPGYGAPPAGYYGAPPLASPYGAPSMGAAGPQKTEKIVIPTVCAGIVIGKGGSIIKDIKMQSSSIITIADPEPTAPGDRVVSISGSGAGIQHAISLIRQRVESYIPPN